MLRALGLRGSNASNTLQQDEKVNRVIDQALNYENALKALDYVLDDRSPEGIRMLEKRDDALSQLALGLVQFIEATLGFEQQTMKLANETLVHSESLSWKEKTFAEKNKIRTSSVYPPGTEWAVTYAEANLLSALLMLLSESMVESAKALLKLRRAYHALDEISKSMERGNLDSGLSNLNLNSDSSSVSLASNQKFVDVPMIKSEQQLKDNQIITRLENLYKIRKARIDGDHIGNPPVSASLRQNLGFKNQENGLDSQSDTEGYDVNQGNSDIPTVDEFIHSGVNLCFGILQVVLSLIPPAIGKVLSVVGFKGSREVGLKMVWKAAKERNIHGGLGLLALLVFYDGPFQFTDVDFDVPSTEELRELNSKRSSTSLTASKTSNSLKSHKSNKDLSKKKMDLEKRATIGNGEPTLLHPGPKLISTLLHARALFPNGNLWLLQESRMLASRGRLEEAVELMDSAKKSEMKQVDALLGFDRAMILVFLQKFERAAEEFLELININTYSHCLYTYFAGACYLECYRMCVSGQFVKNNGKDNVNPEKKDYYAKQAQLHIIGSVDLIGKKRFMSKIPPFEKFIARKVKSINKLKQSSGLSFIDSISTSLVHELAYFWNGYNRMPEENLKFAIKMLGYSAFETKDQMLELVDSTTVKSYSKIPESQEESMIRHTLQAIALRRLGLIEKGNTVLDDNVISKITETGTVNSTEKLLKLSENPWLYPTALYEKALFCWKYNGVAGLDESLEWLKKSQSYGGDDYELSTRVGMKTKAAIDRLEDMI
ncbi:hypothetical protein CANARDRAFT_175186 [[Candida] arabinofermentans NRRL YB-2248]|uniref:Inclusion body clearance protein IML2 n=1 Tax=[Candida] arabinofermentans NRRL YB-2248 TaxID=983967 RepID=A0A1E4T3F9_9ASCO|nr:hypothetical protein CANARDRAFT_175186 [[Candida] arabinofermentans NRRL YB-2248]